jgi:glycosyltransferase involved in cell wall biosynthesis
MNILIFTDREYSSSRFGGREANINDLAIGFQKKNLNPVILSKRSAFTVHDQPKQEFPLFSAFDPLIGLPKFIQKYPIHYVLAFVHSGNILTTIKTLPANSYICIRDADRLDLFKHPDINNFKFLTQHNYIKEILSDIGVKAHTLPVPIQLENYACKIKKKYISVVNLSQKKGIDIAIEVAEALPHLPFLFCASSTNSNAETNSLAQVCESIPNIKFISEVKDIKEIYAQTKVILAPYQWGSSTRILTEAQASGIPSVASTESGLIETVADAGIIVEKNAPIDDWAKRVLSVYENEDNWLIMSKNALGQARLFEKNQNEIFTQFCSELKNTQH